MSTKQRFWLPVLLFTSLAGVGACDGEPEPEDLSEVDELLEELDDYSILFERDLIDEEEDQFRKKDASCQGKATTWHDNCANFGGSQSSCFWHEGSISCTCTGGALNGASASSACTGALSW